MFCGIHVPRRLSGPTTSIIIPWAVLLGSLAQLMASHFDFKKNNPFGSVVFGAYGLFWSAMAGVWLIQMGSFGPEIQKGFDVTQLAFAFVGFLIFSIFGTIASLKTNKVVFAIMVLILSLIHISRWPFLSICYYYKFRAQVCRLPSLF